jgi:hypothetical protein
MGYPDGHDAARTQVTRRLYHFTGTVIFFPNLLW